MDAPTRKPACLVPGFADRLLTAAVAASVAMAAHAEPAPTALPSGGQVVAGQASIAVAGARMDINQVSSKAILNWTRFNIGSQAQVNFNQPGAGAVALNRVISSDPSGIYGTLTANGKVFLINPNGVVFGATAQVDVGALVASTLNIGDADFLAGNYRFSRDGASGSLLNQGRLTAASGGFIALLAPEVRNEGVIQATLGTVALAAGEAVTLSLGSDNTLAIAVDAAQVRALIENRNLIQAGGGSVILSARAADSLLGSAINNSGVIEARSLQSHEGRIVLEGSDSVFLDAGSSLTAQKLSVAAAVVTGQGSVIAAGDAAAVAISGDYVSLAGVVSADNPDGAAGTVDIHGRDALLLSQLAHVSASGADGGAVRLASSRGFVLLSAAVDAHGSAGTGGDIEVSGAASTTLLGAVLDAGGTRGGGQVQLGGKPGSGDLPSSRHLTLDAASRVVADATLAGSGGRVVLWSDGATDFYGKLAARGGPNAGNGGTVEISSAGVVNQTAGGQASVDVAPRAAGYANGSILEDPANVVIGDAVQAFDIWRALIDGAGNLSASAAAPALAANSLFGGGVALNGSYALVGAWGVSLGRGDAYLYNLGTGAWTDLAVTAGQPVTALGDNSHFGFSVALNSSYALIGAEGVAGGRGNAFLYNLGSGTWTDLAATAGEPVTTLAAASQFGFSVALNSSYALIGAYGVASVRGDAHLYELATGIWTDLAVTAGQPVTTLASNSYFGLSVALNSDYALIGAIGVAGSQGNAYLYKLGTGVWTDLASTAGQPVTALDVNSYFGFAVALNDAYALISATSVRGNAYLYHLGTGAWTDLESTAGQPITALATGSEFGRSVAFSNTYALIGATGVAGGRGDAFLYELGTGAWTDLESTAGQPITALATGSNFGTSVALNASYALVGAEAQGSAYLYHLSSHAWKDLGVGTSQPVTAVAGNSEFGVSVALSSGYALIGADGVASNRGDAYLYKLDTGVWTDLATTPGQLVSASRRFGFSVALNDSYALIGALGVASNRGDAYLYQLGTGAWTDLAATAGQPVAALASNSQFGISVALNASYALVGANGVATDRGDAYLYQLGTGAWTDLATTSGQPVTALAAFSDFGIGVALNGNYALIGAIGVSSFRGDAFLYHLGTGIWTDLASTPGQPVTALADASFGASVALNDTHALIGAFGVSNVRGDAYLYRLDTGIWTDLASTAGQPVTGLAPDSYFGQRVALNDNYALIGAYGVANNRGDAYFYNLGNGVWTDLAATAGQPVTALAADSNFGFSVALDSSHALIGAYGVSGLRGNAYLVDLARVADNLSYITPETIAAGLASGNYSITADNNLTIAVPLVLAAANTANALTLQAGNSIFVNAPVDFGARATTLIANAPSASLGNASSRLAGAAGISVAAGNDLSDSGASLILRLTPQAESGRDATYGATGAVSVAANASAGQLVLDAPDAALSATASLSASAAGAALILDGATVDVAGATLSASNGQWLIYDSQTTSAATSAVNLGANSAAFTRFSCSYGSACGNGAVIPASGNGLVYAWAPQLTISGAVATDKIYDASLVTTLGGSPVLNGRVSSGAVTADVQTFSLDTGAALGSFARRHVGSGLGVTASGYTLSDASLGYVLVQPTGLTANITAKTLVISGLSVPSSRVYDASTAAVVNGSGLLAGGEAAGSGTSADGKPYSLDTVSVSGTPVGTYNSKDVLTASSVTFDGLTLVGSDAGNYSLTQQAPTAATITPKSVTQDGLTVPLSKVYDATLVATLGGTAGLSSAEAAGAGDSGDGKPYAGDAVSLTGTALGTYNSKDVLAASSVSFGGLTLAGSDAGNYSLVLQTPTAATITPKTVTQGGLTVPLSKVYDASLVATVGGAAVLPAAEAAGTGDSSDGKPYAGDAVSLTGTALGSYDSRNVASAGSVTFSGLVLAGAQAGNYSLTLQASAAATITGRPLTLIADDKTAVSGSPLPPLSLSYSGLASGDTPSSAFATEPSISTTAFAGSIPGTYSISVSGGMANDYLVSYQPGTLTLVDTGFFRDTGSILAGTPSAKPPLRLADVDTGNARFPGNSLLDAPITGITRSGPAEGTASGATGGARFVAIAQAEAARRQVRTESYKFAIDMISENPAIADLPPCAAGAAATALCIPEAAEPSGAVGDALGGTFPPSEPRRKLALMFGNNSYRNKIVSLDTPIGDVKAIGEVLSKRMGYEVRVVENAGKRDMIAALKQLAASVTVDDSVVIMYAGHGYQMADGGRGFWLPTDAKPTDATTWVSNSDVSKLLGAIRAKQVVLVSDSCFSGTLTKEQKIEVKGQTKQTILTRRAVVALSSGGEEPVSDEGFDGHSIFAYYLLKQLDQTQGFATAAQVHDMVRFDVSQDYPQEPHLGGLVSAGHVLGGDYLFLAN